MPTEELSIEIAELRKARAAFARGSVMAKAVAPKVKAPRDSGEPPHQAGPTAAKAASTMASASKAAAPLPMAAPLPSPSQWDPHRGTAHAASHTKGRDVGGKAAAGKGASGKGAGGFGSSKIINKAWKMDKLKKKKGRTWAAN
jgi:hypothetical protein